MNSPNLFRRQIMFKLQTKRISEKNQMHSKGKVRSVAIISFINSSERSKCFSLRTFREDKNPSREIKCVPHRSSQSKNSFSMELKYLGGLHKGDS